MADKRIDQLTAATSLTAVDLMVTEQSGVAKKVTGDILANSAWNMMQKDASPTKDSTAPVTSGAVYDALGGVFSPTKLATPGALVHIEDGAYNQPVQGMRVAVNLVQNLHGYDHPWPGGGGKNKLENTAATVTKQGLTYTVKADGTVTVNGTATANSYLAIACSLTFDVPSIVSGTPTPIISGVYIAAVAGGSNYNDTTGDGVTIPANTEITAVRMRIDNGVTVSNVVFRPMVRLASETDATFEPYSNICPISGRTEAKLTRTGKNLLNTSKYQFNVKTVYLGISTNPTKGYIYLTAGTYSLSAETLVISKFFIQADGEAPQGFGGGTTNPQVSFTVAEDNYYKIWLYQNGQLLISDIKWVQLEKHSAVTAYEPYKGEVYEISFGSAGTVYDGALTYNGDGTWALTVESANIASYNGETLPGKWISSKDVYAPGTMPTVGAQVVYDLASPQTYTLTGPEITTLLGINNIWADCGEIEELAYRADIGLYLVEALNPIKEMLAYREDTMRATRAYTAGDFIVVGDTFYKVAVSIANGATLTPGTNVIKTTVGDQLKALS